MEDSSWIWSYSKITTYVDCPYKFFLSYILKFSRDRLFFAEYGSFMHKIIELNLNGVLKSEDTLKYYLTYFSKNITGQAPNIKVFNNYFKQGYLYTNYLYHPYRERVTDVERKLYFKIGDNRFVGIIDTVIDNGNIILDNKSRILKPRSNRKVPTLYDKELDKYLRQLYVYAAALYDNNKILPEYIGFNCFRSNDIILEEFKENNYKDTLTWLDLMIKKIKDEEKWNPIPEYFKCKYLCDVCRHCEYCGM